MSGEYGKGESEEVADVIERHDADNTIPKEGPGVEGLALAVVDGGLVDDCRGVGGASTATAGEPHSSPGPGTIGCG